MNNNQSTRRRIAQGLLFFFFSMTAFGPVMAQVDFRVAPYLQNPTPDGITILWLSPSETPGDVAYVDENGAGGNMVSTPVQVDALDYPQFEIVLNEDEFPDGAPPVPYLHRVRIEGLTPQTAYQYTVTQGGSTFAARFRTAPERDRSQIRFIVYADSETEPESSTKPPVDWADPTGATPDRPYLIDQTLGYANNLAVMRSRQPDFVVIAGDLVESGGEQRDWDEFWRHNANPDGAESFAGHIPVFPTLGNHEYFSSPHRASTMPEPKEYNQPYSEEGIARYLTYFELPANGAANPNREERYYRVDYGPVTLISLDVSNNSPEDSSEDTNFFLLGEAAGGGFAPDFGPGSEQHAWLEAQLQEAQQNSRFTFVVTHYVPYSSGPHGRPAGENDGEDPLSGVPVQTLMPMFLQYGVDALFAGHDEMWERSSIAGQETLSDGTLQDHELHIYDLGIGGDGLRGPVDGLENPNQQFLVHTDVPEVWEGNRLVDGGKHYGHLEVNIRLRDNRWQADLVPVYVFPIFDAEGATYQGFERRVYLDSLTLVNPDSISTVANEAETHIPNRIELESAYPNPFREVVTLTYALDAPGAARLAVYDVLGREVATLAEGHHRAGRHAATWDARTMPAGVYFTRLSAGGHARTRRVVRR